MQCDFFHSIDNTWFFNDNAYNSTATQLRTTIVKCPFSWKQNLHDWEGSTLCKTAHVHTPLDHEVTFHSPVCTPRVAHHKVVLAILISTITHSNYSMVNSLRAIRASLI